MGKAKKGDLRVYWIPQIPMKAFYVPVKSPQEAHWLLGVLARYDEFQFANNIKPDYCNAGGLQIFDECDDGEWTDWYDPETGCDIDHIGFSCESH